MGHMMAIRYPLNIGIQAERKSFIADFVSRTAEVEK
jgi:hypothetical protein